MLEREKNKNTLKRLKIVFFLIKKSVKNYKKKKLIMKNLDLKTSLSMSEWCNYKWKEKHDAINHHTKQQQQQKKTTTIPTGIWIVKKYLKSKICNFILCWKHAVLFYFCICFIPHTTSFEDTNLHWRSKVYYWNAVNWCSASIKAFVFCSGLCCCQRWNKLMMTCSRWGR